MNRPSLALLPDPPSLRDRFLIDWSRVIADIQDAGLSQVEIARRCGTSQAYISQLKAGVRGGNVGYDLGAALLELREEVRLHRS